MLSAVVGGGYYAYTHYEIRGLENLQFQPRGAKTGQDASFDVSGFLAPVPEKAGSEPLRPRIRIATFNLGPLDHKKMAKRHVVGSLVKLIRKFDVVAVQDIRSQNHGLLLELVEEVNVEGRQYDVVVSPDVGRRPIQQYCAYLYDKDVIYMDPGTVYSVTDEEGSFRRAPLVTSFAARGPDPAQAFTFTLVNVHVDRDRAVAELNILDDAFRAVRDDGRGEDDVILLGHLALDEQSLGELGELPRITSAVSRVPTTTRGTRMADNLIFDRLATAEFTGRADVVDVLRELNLSMQEALEISDHLPVWAEFSVYEGGYPARVANRP
jgi:hypothetical protein